jgi:hypothetical protein
VSASGVSEGDCGEADGMYIGRGNRSSQRKPAPAPLLNMKLTELLSKNISFGQECKICFEGRIAM